ncbi:hypothetical protein SAMN05421505_104119 [Sinosporangium album]|uniref:Uncharacterized protein n=1 Tax=Sinosporangium album TaxID=504805 RepID=A0A1G7U6H3_9ACTN|nr:hypothetical protein [Sinosporangium album]SDG43027.1 hypothetical protein SAMN05421505_104119 [Sinosporangium album]
MGLSKQVTFAVGCAVVLAAVIPGSAGYLSGRLEALERAERDLRALEAQLTADQKALRGQLSRQARGTRSVSSLRDTKPRCPIRTEPRADSVDQGNQSDQSDRVDMVKTPPLARERNPRAAELTEITTRERETEGRPLAAADRRTPAVDEKPQDHPDQPLDESPEAVASATPQPSPVHQPSAQPPTGGVSVEFYDGAGPGDALYDPRDG